MTRIGPRICLKVPCAQIWAKKSIVICQKEVSQMANCNLCKLKPPKNRENISLNVAKTRRQCQICSMNFEPEVLEFKCGPN